MASLCVSSIILTLNIDFVQNVFTVSIPHHEPWHVNALANAYVDAFVEHILVECSSTLLSLYVRGTDRGTHDGERERERALRAVGNCGWLSLPLRCLT